MKVPTFRKFGITKSEFEGVEKKTERMNHFLTHQVPFVIGLTGGIIIYLSVSKKFSPVGIPQFIQQIFVFGTIVILSIGISMLIFFAVNYCYHAVFKKSSSTYKKSVLYKDDRDKYEFWKLRMDDTYWSYLDSLSVEKEVLYLYSLAGYSIKSEISADDSHLDYILINGDKNTVYLKCFTVKHQVSTAEIDVFFENHQTTRTDEIHIISVRGFEKNLKTKMYDNKIKLLSPSEVSLMVREQIEKSNKNKIIIDNE